MISRAMLASDLSAVHCLEVSATDYPWSYNQLQDSLHSDDCWVMVERELIVAFAIFSSVLDETSLLNIAVAPHAQGKGVGLQLLNECLLPQVSSGARNCFLEVRESNAAAIALYQKLLFSVVGKRKNYYPAKAGREAALVMRKDLSL